MQQKFEMLTKRRKRKINFVNLFSTTMSNFLIRRRPNAMRVSTLHQEPSIIAVPESSSVLSAKRSFFRRGTFKWNLCKKMSRFPDDPQLLQASPTFSDVQHPTDWDPLSEQVLSQQVLTDTTTKTPTEDGDGLTDVELVQDPVKVDLPSQVPLPVLDTTKAPTQDVDGLIAMELVHTPMDVNSSSHVPDTAKVLNQDGLIGMQVAIVQDGLLQDERGLNDIGEDLNSLAAYGNYGKEVDRRATTIEAGTKEICDTIKCRVTELCTSMENVSASMDNVGKSGILIGATGKDRLKELCGTIKEVVNNGVAELCGTLKEVVIMFGGYMVLVFFPYDTPGSGFGAVILCIFIILGRSSLLVHQNII
jgi:hypothetical protein